MTSKLLAAALLAASSTIANAVTYTLDFNAAAACGTTACTNNALISQGYGDVAGVVDLSYRSIQQAGNVTTSGGVYWYGPDYGSLSGVIYGDASEVLEIQIFAADPTAVVTFGSVRYAGWPDTDRATSFRLYNRAGQLIDTRLNTTAPGTGFATYAPGITAVGGFYLEFGPDGYNAGLDDLTFSIDAGASPAVPEPASWGLMLLGFGLTGAALRRRRPAVACAA